MEYRVLKPDGGLRWIAAQAQPLPGPRGLKLVGMCQDITERKQAEEEVRRSKESLEEKVQVRTAALKQSEEQLRHLSTRLLAAQEDERKLISMDLHDSIAASLSAIKMKLQRLTPERDEPVDVQKSLQEAVRIIDGAVAEVRRIMVNLRPSMLDDLGVLPTIKHHCREFHKLHPTCRISTALDITEGEIPEPLKIVVFRVLQEALTNVGKHSQAMHVKVSLGKEDGQITLTVADNGCGFALQSAAVSSKHGKRFGLSSMHERVRLSGGSFVLQSSRGKGTLLRACWPQGELE